MDDIISKPPAGLIRQLRDVIPARALGLNEAYTLAEHQAAVALRLLRVTGPHVPLRWVMQLPKIEVQLEPRHRMTGLAGMSTWEKGRYLIIVNKNDPHGRRRFTLAHEFKHILDYTLYDTIYLRLGNGDKARRQHAIEQLADHFAACLLMPKTWVKQAWATGIQDTDSLAGLFNVSATAMQVRLQYLGFDHDDRPTAVFFRRQPTLRELARGLA